MYILLTLGPRLGHEGTSVCSATITLRRQLAVLWNTCSSREAYKLEQHQQPSKILGRFRYDLSTFPIENEALKHYISLVVSCG